MTRKFKMIMAAVLSAAMLLPTAAMACGTSGNIGGYNKPSYDCGVEKPDYSKPDCDYNKPDYSKPDCDYNKPSYTKPDCGTSVTPSEEESFVSKLAESTDTSKNEYEVTLSVPGEDGEKSHDEVIIMVDASYSGDYYWDDMRNAIYAIGDAVLDGSGNTQITLMSFAMCGHTVLEHIKTQAELETILSGSEPGSLLYGLSSTNCEVGFTWIDDYLDAHDDTLNSAYVFYISDGNANTHEEPFDYSDWKNRTWTNYKSWTNEVLARGAFSVEVDAIAEGAVPSDAFTSVFGSAPALDTLVDDATDEQIDTVLSTVWNEVYAEAGLTVGVAYPVSVVERAFVTYDINNNTFVQYYFYYTAMGRGYANSGARATEAGIELTANDKLEDLYMIDTNAINSWITNIASTKMTATQSNGVVGLITALEGTLNTLSKTPYNDVVVTDYMSKWVNLDPSTIAIVDNKTGETIYTVADGWLIAEADRPTSAEVPVTVEIVTADEYALGGSAVAGNTHGDIYKLTWNVKDGAMLRTDSYSLTYKVTADTQERGFSYYKAYPANGITTVNYLDENGTAQDENITVPTVVAKTKIYTGGNKDNVVGGCDKPSYDKPSCNKPSYSYGGCGDRYNKNNCYDPCGKDYNRCDYKEVKICDGETKYFDMCVNKNGREEIVGCYSITRVGNSYYTKYSLNDKCAKVTNDSLTICGNKDGRNASSCEYGEWARVYSEKSDTVYVCASWKIER